jgi:hemoglobin-like flavoprotein
MKSHIEQLQNAVKLAQQQIELADKSVNLAMEKLIQSTPDDEYKQMEQNIVQIKEIFNKAKQGKNVDQDIKNLSKQYKKWE